MHVHVRMCIVHIYIYICTHVSTLVCKGTIVETYIYIYDTYIYIFIHIYVYIYIYLFIYLCGVSYMCTYNLVMLIKTIKIKIMRITVLIPIIYVSV